MTVRAVGTRAPPGPEGAGGEGASSPRASEPQGRSLVGAAGLTPCPSGIIVLLFALANGVFVLGVWANVVMAIGMGVTVSAVGGATIVARRPALRPLTAPPPVLSRG